MEIRDVSVEIRRPSRVHVRSMLRGGVLLLVTEVVVVGLDCAIVVDNRSFGVFSWVSVSVLNLIDPVFEIREGRFVEVYGLVSEGGARFDMGDGRSIVKRQCPIFELVPYQCA